ncbi:MAG TPA: hypothetical protein VII19_04745 [Acidimicrobiales bacterium]
MMSIGGMALVAAVLTGCSSPSGTASGSSAGAAAGSIPLAASFASPTGTWATLAMGHLDDPLNTFWELLHLPADSPLWALATPPGVASNGGLVAAVAPSGALTAGFGTSLLLRFSPLAQSTDQGATWTAGVLPGGLAPVPDALATSSVARNAALLGAGGREVVSSGGDLSSWHSIARTGVLGAGSSAAACGIEALTAVAVRADGDVLAGAACVHGGAAGVYRFTDGTWHSVGPSLPGSVGGPARVVRLLATPSGATALISAGTGGSGELVAATSSDGLVSWSVSPPLPTAGRTLVSTGVTPAGGLIAVTEDAHGDRSASVIDPSVAGWLTLAPLPAGTTVVAAGPTGGFDALIVSQSTLGVDTLASGRWQRSQTLDVPIVYGSSGGSSG